VAERASRHAGREPLSEQPLRFDGRVAVVTGAGGNPSLGRSYALLLASRGANVVVNDLGTGPDGRGVQRVHAADVAREIVAAGGEAIADENSVADPESARAIVQAALDNWGRIDILVNNAGARRHASFDEISDDDIELIVGSHLLGTIWMSRAVWAHMHRARYGRIVIIASRAALGSRYTTIYGAVKSGIVGLTRGLAIEGAEYGIGVNAVAPGATTAAIGYLTTRLEDSPERAQTTPEQVAPLVGLLAHETCDVSGKLFISSGGRSVEVFYNETRGWTGSDIEIEDVRDHFADLTDRRGSTDVPDPIAMAGPGGASFTPRPYRPGESRND
jgi:NAD(P)-dependent dehydrogenase (short-subunit alcohol dehydrogenase family)